MSFKMSARKILRLVSLSIITYLIGVQALLGQCPAATENDTTPPTIAIETTLSPFECDQETETITISCPSDL